MGAWMATNAVPAKPTPITFTQADGSEIQVMLRGDENGAYYETLSGEMLKEVNGFLVKASAAERTEILEKINSRRQWRSQATEKAVTNRMQARPLATTADAGIVPPESRYWSYPRFGEPKALVILVEFKDVSFTVPSPNTLFTRMMNEEGFSDYGAKGSCKDYFKVSSNNQFAPDFKVYGPVKLSKNRKEYGGNLYGQQGYDKDPEGMVVEACKALDGEIDFSEFDTDHDGVVDNIYVFYAGYGENDGGGSETIWPHSFDLSSSSYRNTVLDGVYLDHYATSAELEYARKRLCGIGVFCHEFSHVLSMPDLYATDNSHSYTPNSWSVLDYGCYNSESHLPCPYTGYERFAIGWVQPKIFDEADNITLRSISDEDGYGDVYYVPTKSSNEYFIIENRQRKGWDAAQETAMHGMLVWHIDFNASKWNGNTVNNTSSHMCVDIVESSGSPSAYSRDGDPFPGKYKVTSFTSSTKPAFVSWVGEDINYPITDIKEQNGLITFKVLGGAEALGEVSTAEPNPESIFEDSFTATWNPAKNATGYFLTVYSVNEGQSEPETETVDFTGYPTTPLPEGWTTDCTGTYTSIGNYGKTAPSITMGKGITSGATCHLTSREYPDFATSITFWYKWQNAKDCILNVEALVNGEWLVANTMQAGGGTSTGTKSTVDLPQGTTQVRFFFRKSTGNIAIDDIEITHGGGKEYEALEDYNRLDVGNTNEFVVTGLEAETTYAYIVTAYNANGEERTSDRREVTTAPAEHDGVNVITAADKEAKSMKAYTVGTDVIVRTAIDARVEIYDVTGRLIISSYQGEGETAYTLPDAGVYIVRAGSAVEKVVR